MQVSNFLCCGSLLGILRPAAALRKAQLFEVPLTLPLPRLPRPRPNREELRSRSSWMLMSATLRQVHALS